MAIFTADEFNSTIQRCWLNGREVTGYATRANIPAVESLDDMPPAAGWLDSYGSIDILDSTDLDGEPVARRRFYGKIRLVWKAGYAKTERGY